VVLVAFQGAEEGHPIYITALYRADVVGGRFDLTQSPYPTLAGPAVVVDYETKAEVIWTDPDPHLRIAELSVNL
jgi:hypothetical protein